MEDMADDQVLNTSIEEEELKLDRDENEPEYETRSEVSSTSLDHGKSEKRGTLKTLKSNHQYDYITKLNYLFRDSRFFIIKSNNEENIAISKERGVWSTLPTNESKLNEAYDECRNVLLIFSVRESGKFAGFARLSGKSRRDASPIPWVLPYGFNPRNLSGVFYVDWICRKSLPFAVTTHLLNEWNDMKPVKIGRDGQEVEPKAAEALLRLFPEDDKIDLTPTLRKSKAAARKEPARGSLKGPRRRSPHRRQLSDLRSVLPRSRFRAPPLNGHGRHELPRVRSAAEIAFMHGLPPLPFGPPGLFPPAGFEMDLAPSPIYPRYYDVGLPHPSSVPALMPPSFIAVHEKRKYDRSVDEFLLRTRPRISRSRSRSQERVSRRGDERQRDRRRESPRRERARQSPDVRRDRYRGRQSPDRSPRRDRGRDGPRDKRPRPAERDRGYRDRDHREGERQGRDRRETRRSRSRSRSPSHSRRYR